MRKGAFSVGSLVKIGQRAMSSAASQHTGFLELREYTLNPSGISDFIKLASETSSLRNSLLPFLGMFTCDTGGTLNRVIHLYHYTDFDQRDAARKTAANTPAWSSEFIPKSRQYVTHQESSIYLPAVPVLEAAQSTPVQDTTKNCPVPNPGSPPATYELRQYQLHPGYGSVPKLIEAFKKGVPEKIAADPENGSLVYFGHTDVGVLNTVIELWRYPTAGACIRARQAARQVPVWRETIGSITPGVQHFRSIFMNPLPFSPMQ